MIQEFIERELYRGERDLMRDLCELLDIGRAEAVLIGVNLTSNLVKNL